MRSAMSFKFPIRYPTALTKSLHPKTASGSRPQPVCLLGYPSLLWVPSYVKNSRSHSLQKTSSTYQMVHQVQPVSVPVHFEIYHTSLELFLISSSWIGRINMQVISLHLQISCFVSIDKLTVKFTWRSRRPKIANPLLKAKNEARGRTLPDFKP